VLNLCGICASGGDRVMTRLNLGELNNY